MKNVENTFTRTVAKSGGRVRFFGNVRVGDGGQVNIEELRQIYDAVVLSYGAEQDKELGNIVT